MDYNDLYHWRTPNGAERDRMVVEGMRRTGYEFRYTDSPKTSQSMHMVLQDLALDRLNIKSHSRYMKRYASGVSVASSKNKDKASFF